MMRISLISAVLFLLFVACNQSSDNQSEKLTETMLFASLPDYCPTPDAFALSTDGTLALSCPNYAEKTVSGVIVTINKKGEASILAKIPGIKDSTWANPMGMAYGPNGELYVCASRGNNQGRLLCLSFEDNELDKIEVVAEGLNGPNGLRYYEGALYVTLPIMPSFKSEKNTSGVYRFLTTDRNLKVNSDSTDANLIFTVQTQNPDRQFGLDGIEFNNKGELLVCDFGDATVYKLTLNESGKVLEQDIYAEFPNDSGIDGMIMDKKNNLYLAGFSQNKLLKVDAKGNTSIVAEYADNDGANGELDQPVDLVFFDGKLLISNFDLMVQKGMINSKHSKPYTVSYISMDEL